MINMAEQDLDVRVAREFAALFLNSEPSGERRRSRRVACDPTTICVNVGRNGEAVAGKLMNISKAGIGMQTGRALPLGTSVELVLEHTLVMATVRYCQMNPDRSFHVGLEIVQVVPRV
jgi:hypothetical protein